MPGDKERLNVYVCQTCGGAIKTIDREDGVTPFMLKCRATKGCDGLMASRFYKAEMSPPELVSAEPTFEWYRPPAEELAEWPEAMRDHFLNGGLTIRQIEIKEESR
jgi:hypothetical protein